MDKLIKAEAAAAANTFDQEDPVKDSPIYATVAEILQEEEEEEETEEEKEEEESKF